MRFKFIGNLGFSTKKDAVSIIGDSGIKIDASIAASNNNRAFIEMVGWANDDIKTLDINRSEMVVDWDDRFDEDVLKNVADFKKHVITDDSGKHEFLTEYDFCEYVKKHHSGMNGQKYKVTGSVQEDFYKGKEYKKFQIDNMYLISDDETPANLSMTADFYWDKDGIDLSNFKSEQRIYIKGYTQEFISKKYLNSKQGEYRYVPFTLIFDASAYDLQDETDLARCNHYLKALGFIIKDGKLTNRLKSNKYYVNKIEISYHNGAKDMGDSAEITMDMLTDYQKEKIKLGLAKLSDYASKGKVYGERVVEYLFKDAEDLPEIADLDADEFEEKIFAIYEEDTDDEPKPKKKKVEKEKDSSNNFFDDDFMPEPEDSDEDEEEEELIPKKGKAKSQKKTVVVEDDEDEYDDSDDESDEIFL